METEPSRTTIPLPEGGRNGIEHICADVLSKGYVQCHWMVVRMYFPDSTATSFWVDAAAWFKARGVRAELMTGTNDTIALSRI